MNYVSSEQDSKPIEVIDVSKGIILVIPSHYFEEIMLHTYLFVHLYATSNMFNLPLFVFILNKSFCFIQSIEKSSYLIFALPMQMVIPSRWNA